MKSSLVGCKCVVPICSVDGPFERHTEYVDGRIVDVAGSLVKVRLWFLFIPYWKWVCASAVILK